MMRFTAFPGAVLAGLVLLAAGLMPLSGAAASKEGDHERARAARLRGEVLPLARILTQVERDFHGRVIEVEFEDEDGLLVYELELLLPDGRVIEVEIDARSGEPVKLEGSRLETVFKVRPPAAPASR